MKEYRLLSKEQIRNAENADRFSHPALAVLRSQQRELKGLQQAYKDSRHIISEEDFIENHYGTIADAFVEAEDYSLDPESLLSIWSQGAKNLSNNEKTAIARMITAAYCVKGNVNSIWNDFPRALTEGMISSMLFLDQTNNDEESLVYISNRLEEVYDSVHSLQNTQKLYDDQGVQYPLLDEVIDSFGNGISSIQLLLDTY